MNDLTGNRYGKLTVIGFSHWHESPSGCKSAMWKCKCDCGNVTEVRAYRLKSGETRSCGCLKHQKKKLGKYTGKSLCRYKTVEECLNCKRKECILDRIGDEDGEK